MKTADPHTSMGSVLTDRSHASIVVQCIVAYVLAVFIYMLLAVLDSDLGFDGLVSLVTIGLISAMFFSALSVGVCLVVGLPIRYFSPLRQWWRRQYWLAPLIGIAGLGIILFSILPANLEWVKIPGDPEGREKLIPPLPFVLTGWFASIFGVLHTFLPSRAGGSASQAGATQPN
ncbi:MAG: hypothetical protein ACO1NQ_11405, partial [Flavobacteriales bacterium]